MTRWLGSMALLVACGGSSSHQLGIDALDQPDASRDAAPDAPGGFGVLGGDCGVLTLANLTGTTPALFRATFTFDREFMDPADRPLLTMGGRTLLEVPNAGGSSALSEAFSFEELARCEHAELLKTETQIVYTTPGKITDLEISLQSHKIGVSVTRAFAFPLGTPYTVQQATTLITRKLQDILTSTANVSPGDKWDKQILAVDAYDDQAADVVTQVWNGLDAATKADTLVVISVTNGADTFIYTNQ